MTVEMGPRDADLSLSERVAGHCVRFWTWFISLDDGPTVRFDPSTATIRVSGESEHSGDEFVRGRNITQLTAMNSLTMIGVVGMVAAAPIPPGALELPYLLTSTALMLGCAFVMKGSIGLASKIDVIDHTTEPAPDAIDDLEAAYLADEIDEEELDERAAEVWANE